VSAHVDILCASCGVEFCMPAQLNQQRRRNHDTFYCPNGHQNVYKGKTEEEKRIEQLERRVRALLEQLDEAYAQREDLIGALKECPVQGCPWHSRKQVPRDPVSMGRGIERVRADLLEHLVRDHAGRAQAPRELTAG
jgi:hypothetical protein